MNRFDGSLPANMFNNLPNLQVFSIGGNQISGLMPTSVANASTLTYVDMSRNYFVGQIPSLGRLQYLWRLNLEIN
jgi:Leucine-rich repeat (LRR) protein